MLRIWVIAAVALGALAAFAPNAVGVDGDVPVHDSAAADAALHDARAALTTPAPRIGQPPSPARLVAPVLPAPRLYFDGPASRGTIVARDGNGRALRLTLGCTREPRAPPSFG